MNNNHMIQQPLVTVLITTYNQEKYIGKAIESVLAQKTNFPYEILISEDCGSDKTADILLDYARKYDCIHLKLRSENVGISKNWFEGLQKARGKYVCTLEGDDWWRSPTKLQKQVDFLEAHPDYAAVSHTILQTDDEGNTYGAEPHDPRILNRDATSALFLSGITFSCTACLCRNIFAEMGQKEYDYVTHNRFIADFALCMLILNAGRVFVLDEPLAAYRVAGKDSAHNNYNTGKSAVQKYKDFLDVVSASNEYWAGRYTFTKCILSGTYFPFCDRLRGGDRLKFVKAMFTMPLKALLLFPFYFIGKSVLLLYARIVRSVKR